MRFTIFSLAVASSAAFVASPLRVSRPVAQSPVVSMAAAADDFVPDMQRRTIMNLVLLGGAAGLTAKDALGDDVTVAGWAKAHPFPERSLVQGLKGDAHYLIVKQDGSLENYAINAVCTHLGCVVPWNR